MAKVVAQCPNCGNADPHAWRNPPVTLALVAVTLDDEGNIHFDGDRGEPVTEFICNQCDYIMLFSVPADEIRILD